MRNATVSAWMLCLLPAIAAPAFGQDRPPPPPPPGVPPPPGAPPRHPGDRPPPPPPPWAMPPAPRLQPDASATPPAPSGVASTTESASTTATAAADVSANVPAIVAEPLTPDAGIATQTVANAAPLASAVQPRVPPSESTALLEPPTAPAPAHTIGWLLALSLAVLAWWASARRSRRLADEAAALTRQQRQLRNAHQQLQADSAQLRKLSIHDPLTGTLNRQAFANELRELTDQLSRYSRPLTLIVFDLDHFKQINDRQGHLAGDAALKLVVGIVREHLVSADLFGRFGGDEFLIACADQSPASCLSLAETIRRAVEAQAPAHDPPLPGLTLSMGLAQADASSGYDPDALFARADAALYAAKRCGRNCVVAADESLPDPDAHALQRHL